MRKLRGLLDPRPGNWTPSAMALRLIDLNLQMLATDYHLLRWVLELAPPHLTRGQVRRMNWPKSVKCWRAAMAVPSNPLASGFPVNPLVQVENNGLDGAS